MLAAMIVGITFPGELKNGVMIAHLRGLYNDNFKKYKVSKGQGMGHLKQDT